MCGCGGGGGSSVKQPAQNSAKVAGVDYPSVAPGERLPGDVYARVLFKEGSPKGPSGRDYGYLYLGQFLWVDKRDVDAHRNWFKQVREPV